MNKVDTNSLFNSLLDAKIEFDLAQKVVELATAVNELSDETDAKRYAMLIN